MTNGPKRFCRQFLRQETGATAVEYGLMMGILALGLLTAVALSGERIAAVFNFILQDFTDGVTGTGGG